MAETFDVTSQVQSKKLGPSGQLVPTTTIFFTTKPHGLTGSVDVPTAQATPDVVRDAVCAQVDNMTAIQNL